ncbi:DUF1801 domain-containing protein [uncultured Roseovarius sp.]|uniref:DUF1801 domain-containing protein n=1 Tax=uncultured Roseovarius sp. TaxID=293344 RepID=UPI00263146B2|nr:DUF1801 domain-containing protein [uncultured Roseovarius sp.]
METPVISSDVDRVISRYDPLTRSGVLALRALIFQTAGTLPQTGGLQEALRWGQPAYLTKARAGSTLRLGPHKDARFAIFAHCQSTIIASYAQAFPGWDRIDGNRAVLFDEPSQIEPERLTHLIRHALTYHLSDAA